MTEIESTREKNATQENVEAACMKQRSVKVSDRDVVRDKMTEVYEITPENEK